MSIYRAMRTQPAYLSAFVPFTEDFLARQNRRRNAIIADVLPPANLEQFPQETIANALANRYSRYPNDLLVTRYSERDIVVFLPEWVQSDQLVRREHISLGDLRLRCFTWDPYNGARRSPIPYRALIYFVSLPYECWSSRMVAAFVGGFGRFLRADDRSSWMDDLTGYYRVGVDTRGNPPPPHNERSAHHDLDVRTSDALLGHNEEEGDQHSSASNTWNFSEIRDRRSGFLPDNHPVRLDRPTAATSQPPQMVGFARLAVTDLRPSSLRRAHSFPLLRTLAEKEPLTSSNAPSYRHLALPFW
uniref:DUF4283 domain-containing protein n=1 Tax=Ananas comosus var. bracteatus TaxID=296719 RepID=A0A6V7QHD9_ANACO|nr:unnamed protein product [Ananas comosus var. bracteatus]